MTLKPSLCSRWQIAVPMPPMPPVTYAIFWLILISLMCYKFQSDPSPPWAGPIHCDPLRALYCEGNPHAAADTQRGQTLLRFAPLHLVQQGDQDPAARCTDRVADGNGAAVHVDLGRIDR